MFRNHVEAWLPDKDTHVISYMQNMLDNGHDTLTDFQEEIKLLTDKMSKVEHGAVEYMLFWSVRSWLEECIRWYVPESLI